MLPRLGPLPIKNRLSIIFVEKGRLDVLDGSFVVVDKNGVRTHIPVGSVACLMLEPGTRISHAAVGLAARVGCLLVWVGEAGVRLYAAGQPGGARPTGFSGSLRPPPTPRRVWPWSEKCSSFVLVPPLRPNAVWSS